METLINVPTNSSMGNTSIVTSMHRSNFIIPPLNMAAFNKNHIKLGTGYQSARIKTGFAQNFRSVIDDFGS